MFKLELNQNNINSMKNIMQLYQDINNALSQNKKVQLSFEKLNFTPSIALNLVLNNLYDLYSIKILKEKIELTEASFETHEAFHEILNSLDSHIKSYNEL